MPVAQDTKSVDLLEEKSNTLSFEEKVLKKISGMAVGEVDGVLAISGNFLEGITGLLGIPGSPGKGISVEAGNKKVALEMKVICEYGRNIPQLFDSIVEKVGIAVKDMTGLEVMRLNIHVHDVLPQEEFNKLVNKSKNGNNLEPQEATIA